jgi:hypothetical protein
MTGEQIEFKGSEQERVDLLNALRHNCTCPDDMRDPGQCCPAHSLLHDQRALDHLLFLRHLEPQLISEEFRGAA